jgi:hypothetical protein
MNDSTETCDGSAPRDFGRRLRAGLALVGLDRRPAPWRDGLVSGAGATLAILGVMLVSELTITQGAPWLVASIGASAVLLFAVPHGPLSQPWPLVVGHLVSALAGVACASWIDGLVPAGAAAVGLAVLAMRLTHSIHPPGGATALFAVIGGPEVAQLGYLYVLLPVMLNVGVVLAVAVAFNYGFAWRRYPAGLSRVPRGDKVPAASDLTQADLVYALSEMDTFMDVSEQDLQQIYELAMRHHESSQQWPSPPLEAGQCYSNGRYGADWQVREIVDMHSTGSEPREIVTFRVVAGRGRRRAAKCSRAEFGRWARHRVERNENSWIRTGPEV